MSLAEVIESHGFGEYGGGCAEEACSADGYEAMKLGLDTIASLDAKGNSRGAILKALFATKDRHSVIGTYGFDRNGDTTLRSYGLYKVKGRRGTLVFIRNVNPR